MDMNIGTRKWGAFFFKGLGWFNNLRLDKNRLSIDNLFMIYDL